MTRILIALALLALLVGCGEKEEKLIGTVRIPLPELGHAPGDTVVLSHDPALEYVVRVDTVGWVKRCDTIEYYRKIKPTAVYTYPRVTASYWSPALDTIWGKRIERRYTPDELRRLDELLKGEK